jgi:hypothetical protein
MDMPNRTVLVMFAALAATSCTLPAEDAGEVPFNEHVDGPEAEALEPDQGLVVCRLRVDDPHLSVHEPGNVNVVARTTCTSIVESIELQVTLMRGGLAVATNVHSKPNGNLLKGAAATRCRDGLYQGVARTTIIFPPGHNPNPQTIQETSRAIHIQCGIATGDP